MSDPTIVSTHGIQPVPRPAEFCPTGAATDRFDASTARLTDRLGLKKLGCNITAVAPGRAAYPFHSHRANDELFFVLAGSGELRLGGQRHPVKEGDLIGCPAGDETTAHQLVNTGSTELRYIAISTRIEPEICEYPDSGKVGAYGGVGPGGFYHLTRRSDQADYWDGE
jgi:uncharacterized cupin superfamily protein